MIGQCIVTFAGLAWAWHIGCRHGRSEGRRLQRMEHDAAEMERINATGAAACRERQRLVNEALEMSARTLGYEDTGARWN